MRKNIQHIAFLLLIFTAYPFVFQTLHILHHHGHSVNSGLNTGMVHTHACSSDHDKYGDYDPDTDNSANHALSGRFYLRSSQQDENGEVHCPLCEHEFAKFSLGTFQEVSFTSERLSLVSTYFYQSPPLLYTGNCTSLRAPPLKS
jgi:hypothetical protein